MPAIDKKGFQSANPCLSSPARRKQLKPLLRVVNPPPECPSHLTIPLAVSLVHRPKCLPKACFQAVLREEPLRSVPDAEPRSFHHWPLIHFIRPSDHACQPLEAGFEFHLECFVTSQRDSIRSPERSDWLENQIELFYLDVIESDFERNPASGFLEQALVLGARYPNRNVFEAAEPRRHLRAEHSHSLYQLMNANVTPPLRYFRRVDADLEIANLPRVGLAA